MRTWHRSTTCILFKATRFAIQLNQEMAKEFPAHFIKGYRIRHSIKS